VKKRRSPPLHRRIVAAIALHCSSMATFKHGDGAAILKRKFSTAALTFFPRQLAGGWRTERQKTAYSGNGRIGAERLTERKAQRIQS
jgi:hypothetical protein